MEIRLPKQSSHFFGRLGYVCVYFCENILLQSGDLLPNGDLSPLEECPVELKSTIDRWNKRWPGERDSRDRGLGVLNGEGVLNGHRGREDGWSSDCSFFNVYLFWGGNGIQFDLRKFFIHGLVETTSEWKVVWDEGVLLSAALAMFRHFYADKRTPVQGEPLLTWLARLWSLGWPWGRFSGYKLVADLVAVVPATAEMQQTAAEDRLGRLGHAMDMLQLGDNGAGRPCCRLENSTHPFRHSLGAWSVGVGLAESL